MPPLLLAWLVKMRAFQHFCINCEKFTQSLQALPVSLIFAMQCWIFPCGEAVLRVGCGPLSEYVEPCWGNLKPVEGVGRPMIIYACRMKDRCNGGETLKRNTVSNRMPSLWCHSFVALERKCIRWGGLHLYPFLLSSD